MQESILNTKDYTTLELVLFLIGCYAWVIIYAVYIRNIRKFKFIEMPVFAASGNIAWEFLWSFVFRPDLGLAFVWAYRAWFFLDIYIFYSVLKDGDKQIFVPEISRYYLPVMTFVTLAWGVIFYFFTKGGYDTSIGANSAFSLNLVISGLYILLFFKVINKDPLSYFVAWLKMIATTTNTVFLFLHYPENHFVQTVGVLMFILDNVYIVLLIQSRRQKAAVAA
jgi:hypothetical protein